jgi:demethylmenaquinone methyltransferase / 2-methoxy-6-polyprenyl-1,4-benzoquinol methylase
MCSGAAGMTDDSPTPRRAGTRDAADAGRAAPRIRKMFSAVAPHYDFLNHFLSARRDVAWRRATARALLAVLARPDSLAADLCCGTGDLTLELARYSAGRVLGTDFCHPMLVLARKKLSRRPALFLEADTLALPFPEASLDAATLAFGFRNLENYADGLKEIRRVLKSQGVLAILEFSEVRGPLFGPLFRFYFRHVLPRLGAWISGVAGPYQYLHDSVSKFPNQQALARLLSSGGFHNVRYRNFSGGVAALHLAEKP